MTRLSATGLDLSVGERTLCRGLNLKLLPGQCWAILGGNGSGKTTLLHTLAGMQSHGNGDIQLDGQSIHSITRQNIARHVGLLLQESHDPFPSTVLETALSGRHPHLGRWQNEGEEDYTITRTALAKMDLQQMEQRMVQTLSGGERRRLAIATLLTQSPKLMLLDEPLNHLDLHHQQNLLYLLREISQQGKTVVMVLHDPNQAIRYCDHALLLYGDGKWESGACEELLTTERLSELYRHPMHLLEQAGKRIFIPGTAQTD
jgi:iron complex transport system ATP-binding protein